MRIFNRTSVTLYISGKLIYPMGFEIIDENYIYNSILVFCRIGFLKLNTRFGVRTFSNYYTGITAREINLLDENNRNSIEIIEVCT